MMREDSIELYTKRKVKKNNFCFKLKNKNLDSKVETSSILLI